MSATRHVVWVGGGLLAVTRGSATVSALYGHAGAVYFTTLDGDIDGGEGDDPSSNGLNVLGWRQVL